MCNFYKSSQSSHLTTDLKRLYTLLLWLKKINIDTGKKKKKKSQKVTVIAHH